MKIKGRKKILTGFTLIELMVVVVIIVILASFAIPKFSQTLEKSRQAEATNMLTKMYMGYKESIIDEVLNPTTGMFSNGTDFHPHESDHYPVDGLSDMSWKALGFDANPNEVSSSLYFSYDFLEPGDDYDYLGWSGRNGRPPGTDPVNIAVAWRKTSNIKEPPQGWFYPVDSSRYIYINLTTGAIGKSEPYQ